MSEKQSPFEILEISKEATERELKKAYLKKLRIFPPERDPEGFKRIRTAYDQIRNGQVEEYESLTFQGVQPMLSEQTLQEIEEALSQELTIQERIRLTF